MSRVAVAERQVLEIVRTLVTELRGQPAGDAIGPDSLLEQDLGIYSLERIELMLRLEEAAGVGLDEEAATRATTVGDLANLVRGRSLPARELPAAGFEGRAFAVRVFLHLLPGGPRAARLFQRAARLVFRAACCRIEVTGGQHLRDTVPAVLVANHQSYLDSLVLLAALPILPNIVVNERLPGAPLVGAGVRAARFLAVDRTTVAGRLLCADRMAAALSAGESLLVFPEATFDAGPGLLPFRLGAFSTAAAAGRPVVPITIHGTRRMLPSGGWLLRRSRLSVIVHPPLYPERAGWREALRLRQEVRAQIARACLEAETRV